MKSAISPPSFTAVRVTRKSPMVDTPPDFLQRLRSGEEAAWGELHRDHYSRLWSSVQRILKI